MIIRWGPFLRRDPYFEVDLFYAANGFRTPSRRYEEYLKEAAQDGDDEPLGSEVVSPAINNSPTTLSSPLPTESHSFLHGLLSPFSPLLKQSDMRGEYLQYVSLQPCRKVTCVVSVLPLENNVDEQRCLFPQVKAGSSSLPHNVVVVNPEAFGTHIPSQVTMETARLVTKVAKTSCEDWARLYDFHHVIWPSADTPHGGDYLSNGQSSIDSLSRAIAQDAMVELQSSVVICLGQQFNCMDNEDALWARVLSNCQGLIEDKMVCTISFIEVLDERDSFRDLLLHNEENIQFGSSIKPISIKHGAVLENLTQVPIDTMSGTFEAGAKRKDPNSTVIGTINIWNNAVSHELKKCPDSQISFVELATFPDHESSPENTVFRRKGVVNLGRALRQLLLHASAGTEPVISYRESSLTKVLQRSLESSKIVVMATVSQLSRDYELTLGSLNYLRRLLVKPGATASSPFRHSDAVQQHGGTDTHAAVDKASSSYVYEYAHSPQLLAQIVADPRQRLARLFKSTLPTTDSPQINYAPSEDDYQPIDYMDYDNDPRSLDSVEARPFGNSKFDDVKSAPESRDVHRTGEEIAASPHTMAEQADTLFDKYSVEGLPPRNIAPTKSLANPTMTSPDGDVLPVWAVADSAKIVDEIGTEDSAMQGTLQLGDTQGRLNPVELLLDHRGIAPSVSNETMEYLLPKGDDPDTSLQGLGTDNGIAASYSEYDDAAELDESSTSTVGSGQQASLYLPPATKADTAPITESAFPHGYRSNLNSKTSPDCSVVEYHGGHREELKICIEEKATLEAQLEAMRNEIEDLRGQHASRQQGHQEDLRCLQFNLDGALDEKINLEKVADEAIVARETLEEQLSDTRNELSKAKGRNNLLQMERADFMRERNEMGTRMASMSRALEAEENAKALADSQKDDLHTSVEKMKRVQDSLKRSLEEKEQNISDLKNEGQRSKAELEDLRGEKLRLMVLLNEKDLQLGGFENQTEALRSSLEDVKKERERFRELQFQEETVVHELKNQLQETAFECAQLNEKLLDRDTTVRRIESVSSQIESTNEEMQSRIKELEKERYQYYQEKMTQNEELSTVKGHLAQIRLSREEIKKDLDRCKQMQRSDKESNSNLKTQLSILQEKQFFANREFDRVTSELTSTRKISKELETHNEELKRKNLELIETSEQIEQLSRNNTTTLRIENKQLQRRLRQCSTQLQTCQTAKSAISKELNTIRKNTTKFHSGDAGGSLLDTKDQGKYPDLYLVEEKRRVDANFSKFRSRANEDLRSVRIHHENVVRESEKLKSKLARFQEQLRLLRKENIKLRIQRRQCLDVLEIGRDRIEFIGEIEPRMDRLRTHNPKPELFLKKLSINHERDRQGGYIGKSASSEVYKSVGVGENHLDILIS